MTEELLNKHTQIIDSLTLLPSGKGRFEVIMNDTLIYSKVATGRHAEPGEVMGLFEAEAGEVLVAAD